MENNGQIVNVRIYNQNYTIRANDGNVKRTQQLAALVDSHMNEIAGESITADSLKLAILAALHIADELDRANKRHEQVLRQIADRNAACGDMLDQILS